MAAPGRGCKASHPRRPLEGGLGLFDEMSREHAAHVRKAPGSVLDGRLAIITNYYSINESYKNNAS